MRLKAGITKAKRIHQERLERDLNASNTRDMWQVTQNITGYRSAPIMCESTFACRVIRSTENAILTTVTSECCLLILAQHNHSAGILSTLGLSTTLCNWILDFLTNRPQTVRIDGHTFCALVLNTRAPQGCVLSPLLFTLYTNDCNPQHGENSVVKFAKDTTIISWISNNEIHIARTLAIL